MDPPMSYTRKVLVATAIPLSVALGVWLLFHTAHIVLLFYLGVLLAFLLFLVAVFWLFGRLLAPPVADQLNQLGEQLPQAVERLEERARPYPLIRRALEQLPGAVETVQQTDWLAGVRGLFSVTATVLTGVAVFLAVGIYLAADPGSCARTSW